MSRSYKKTPMCTEGSKRSRTRKYRKRQANKRIRKLEQGFRRKSRDYRRTGTDSWEICDYKFYEPDNRAMSPMERNEWEKYYHRK